MLREEERPQPENAKTDISKYVERDVNNVDMSCFLEEDF